MKQKQYDWNDVMLSMALFVLGFALIIAGLIIIGTVNRSNDPKPLVMQGSAYYNDLWLCDNPEVTFYEDVPMVDVNCPDLQFRPGEEQGYYKTVPNYDLGTTYRIHESTFRMVLYNE